MVAASPSPAVEQPAARVLLFWPGGRVSATLVTLLEDAGVAVDVAASDAEARSLLALHQHTVVLAPPPQAGDHGWLTALVGADQPAVEAIALADGRQPASGAAAQTGAVDWVDPFALSQVALTQLLAPASQRAELKRDRLGRGGDRDGADPLGLHQRSLRLLATMEIERLQELLLEAFAGLCGARSVALWVRTARGQLSLRGHRGSLTRSALRAQIDPREPPWEVPLAAGRAFVADTSAPAGFYLPLLASGQAVGLLWLGERPAGLGGPPLAACQQLAEVAGVALRNAQRFHELERVGLRDRDSPTYNLSYFIDYAGKELYKASRYGRQFSLSTLHLDNLEQWRGRLPPAAFGEAVRRVLAVLASLARDSDVLARVAENELYLILPETDRFGVMMLERRINEALRVLDEQSSELRTPVALTIGSATYPRDGQDFDELLQRCRQRTEEARNTLRRRLQLQGLDFWQSLAALLGPWPARVEAGGGTERSARGRELGSAAGGNSSACYRGPLPEGHFAQVQREVGRELAREPRARGLLYLASADAEPHFPLLHFLPPELSARICLLLKRGLPRPDHPAVSTVYFHGNTMPGGTDFDFLLYLSEASAYAFAQRRRDRFAVHTSDRPLIDHLIAQLQQGYDLQPY